MTWLWTINVIDTQAAAFPPRGRGGRAVAYVTWVGDRRLLLQRSANTFCALVRADHRQPCAT